MLNDSPAGRARRLSWAQCLRRVLEVEPSACPTCPGRLRIVSFLTDRLVVDRIIAQLRRARSGLLPPARGSPARHAKPTVVCRADAAGFVYTHDLPPDE